MGKLDGKIAVITGGSEGIGLATAKLFVSEGAKVVITGRNQATLDAARESIGPDLDAQRSDICKMADIEALRDHMEKTYGRVDIVFANAGGGVPRLFLDTSEEDFDFIVNINFKGSYFTVQKLLPLMTKGGSIIFCTSTNGRTGGPYVSVYSAMKAGLRSLARTLTAELSDRGIRVNALAPGLTDTDLALKSGMSKDLVQQMNAQAHLTIPMHRSGLPAEMATAALFFASDDSSYVTGVELCVDGGRAQI